MTLAEKVHTWITGDVDQDCQEELSALLAAAHTDPAAQTELEDRFHGRLQFGTAGLRGAMAAGPNRMNRAVVIAAARGLVDYLTASLKDQSRDGSVPGHVRQEGPGEIDTASALAPKIVIGNDARHHSREFALDTAGVVTAAGGQAFLLPDQTPTPVLAFAVRYLGADAGVMVTASHNPAADNGYKVYLGGRMVADNERGVQIVPPYDADISARIEAQPPANQIERREGWTDCGPEVMEAYLAAITQGGADLASPIRIVHTAMHGVGSVPARRALSMTGFTDVVSVMAQAEPDPDFPTVSFPNPEEPGAIDLALALAGEVEADVVIANDPDADRCAVAIPDPRRGWRMLHGDELGAVLADQVGPRGVEGVLVNSVVSSRQLELIAEEYGRGYVRTLTGFKWMGRVEGFAFAYEEAIGYCVRPDLVRDKDGLSTAVAVARLVARLKAEGRTIASLLDDLARRHGLYLSSQLAVRFADLAQIPEVIAKLRAQPVESLAASPVVQTVDLAGGWGSLPPTEGILMLTAAADRVVIRPSGTEPKIKCYLEVIEPVSPDASFDDLSAHRTAAADRLTRIRSDLNDTVFA